MSQFCSAYNIAIHEYWNVHRMFLTYIHRTYESRNTKNTYDFLVQVRNFSLPLSLKVLRHKERDTYSFYSGFFICLPRPSRAAPVVRAPKLDPSRPVFSSQLNWLFQNPQNPPRTSGAWRHSHSLAPFPISGFYCDISEWYGRSAHARRHLRSCLHLANPCTEPKGSQPN